MLNKLEVGAGADVDAADELATSEVVVGALSCGFPRLENRLLEGALAEGADAPELLGGLLKRLKLGAVAGDDVESVAERWGWLVFRKSKVDCGALVCAVDPGVEEFPPRLEKRLEVFVASD